VFGEREGADDWGGLPGEMRSRVRVVQQVNLGRSLVERQEPLVPTTKVVTGNDLVPARAERRKRHGEGKILNGISRTGNVGRLVTLPRQTTLTAAMHERCCRRHNPKIVFPLVRLDRQRAGREGARHHDCDCAVSTRRPTGTTRTWTAPGTLTTQEHDHGRRPDGWRDLNRWRRRMSDAADPRHVLLARQVGVPYISCGADKCTRGRSRVCSTWSSWNAGMCLRAISFRGRRAVVRLSALGALNGEEKWEKQIDALMVGGGQECAAGRARAGQAVSECPDRGHFLEYGAGHGGDGPD